jgi:hypothetical protein
METLTLEEAIALLIQVITGDLTHQDYEHTVNKARLYKQLITGKDIDDLLAQFSPRETAIEFEQRKRLTHAITPAVASSLMKPFYKVPRTDRVVKKITPVTEDDSNGDAVKEVQDKLNEFYGSEANVNGLDFFLQNRFIELTFTDPNAFIVTEFERFDPLKEKASPYPFEVPSDKARYFEYVNNKLKVLVIRDDITFEDGLTNQEISDFRKLNRRLPVPDSIQREGFKWTMYTTFNTIVFEQVDSRITSLPGENDFEYNPDAELQKLDRGTFIQYIYTHDAGKVPAKRVGYKRDLETEGRTFVNPFDDALCYFLDSINTVSEYCLTKANHVFPQKVQYAPPCPGESDLNSCFKGRASLGGICKRCGGTGQLPVHTSAQDVVTMPMPENPADMFDLNKVMAYFYPPVELLKFQRGLEEKVKIDCHQTVFNSTSLLRDTTGQAAVEDTATAKNIDFDSINDTLAPFAENFSAFWLFEADLVVTLTDNAGKVDLVHRFPADFKMKTIGDLYTEMKTANDSYAPTFLIELINDDIASTKFQDDPDQLLRYEVKKRLDPFRGMTETMITNALNTDYTPRWKKVLYTNFESILAQAEIDVKEFYIEDYDKQQAKVKELTLDIIAEIDGDKPAAPVLRSIITDPNAVDNVEDDDTNAA